MFCQIATGSLLLSAIGALSKLTAIASPVLAIPHCCVGTVKQPRFVGFRPPASLLRRPKPCHRLLIEIPFPREQPGERTRPPGSAPPAAFASSGSTIATSASPAN